MRPGTAVTVRPSVGSWGDGVVVERIDLPAELTTLGRREARRMWVVDFGPSRHRYAFYADELQERWLR